MAYKSELASHTSTFSLIKATIWWAWFDSAERLFARDRKSIKRSQVIQNVCSNAK